MACLCRDFVSCPPTLEQYLHCFINYQQDGLHFEEFAYSNQFICLANLLPSFPTSISNPIGECLSIQKN